MKLVVLSPSSLPEELLAGLGHLCESEGFAVGEGGIAVTARRAGRFAFRLEENSLEVEYRVPAEFFRALSYLKQPSRQPLAWKQQPAFADNVILPDVFVQRSGTHPHRQRFLGFAVLCAE